MSIKNKKWPERKQELRAEFQVKIWIKPVTDNHWNDAVDAGLLPHGSVCLLIYKKLWKLLCNRQSSWLRYLAVLHSAAPSDSETQGQRDCSIKYIFIKAFFPPNVQTYAFSISFSKTTRYWFWTAFLCSWLHADQAKSLGGCGGTSYKFLLRDAFLMCSLFSQGASEILLLRRSNPSLGWRGVREKDKSLKAGNGETDEEEPTVSPGWGERRQKGVALLPGLSYYLWKATCSYLLQARKFCLYLYILGPKEPFLYVCVQSGRTSKQTLHWCISYSMSGLVWAPWGSDPQRPEYAD